MHKRNANPANDWRCGNTGTADMWRRKNDSELGMTMNVWRYQDDSEHMGDGC